MAMTVIWTGMVVLSLIFGIATGRLDEVASAALKGAGSAVSLSISMAGVMCLWSGVMEVMRRSGLSEKLALSFRPLLRRLLPNACRDSETLAAVSANVSANLLGLGSAATPLGIRAACRMAEGCGGTATDELCLLVVLNTASIQLIPATVAGVRSAAGRRPPSTFCRRYGWLPSCPSRRGFWPRNFWPASGGGTAAPAERSGAGGGHESQLPDRAAAAGRHGALCHGAAGGRL